MKKLLWVVVLAVAAYAGYQHHDRRQDPATATASLAGGDGAPTSVPQDEAPHAATSHSQVQGSGVVVRILPDDDEGSRHQRFILRTPSGQSCWSQTTSTLRRGSATCRWATRSTTAANTCGTRRAAWCTGPTTIPRAGTRRDG